MRRMHVSQRFISELAAPARGFPLPLHRRPSESRVAALRNLVGLFIKTLLETMRVIKFSRDSSDHTALHLS